MLVLKDRKNISRWLLIGVFMVFVQFLLGGITRLTGSGLSITEWQPLLGFIPPLSDWAWEEAFRHYQQTAQYQYLNSDFDLSDFKFIYFWEWFHRFWARLMGLVFVFPFLYFIYRGSFSQRAILPFLGLLVLGAIQGAVGWIMVLSGLEESTLFVGHIELALHFITAVVLMLYLYRLFLMVREEAFAKNIDGRYRPYVAFVLVLGFIQLYYGGLMAGLHGGTFAPTWPNINGQYFPLASGMSLGQYLLFDPIGVHLVHRSGAYLLLALVLYGYFFFRKHGDQTWMRSTLIVVAVQVSLGILTVLWSPRASFMHFGSFECMALLHQTGGLLFILSIYTLVFYAWHRWQR